jgi:ribose 5-phosphate isomerase B
LKIAIGSDHAGFEVKEFLKGFVADLGHEVEDLGAFTPESSDYPDWARLVAEKVASGGAEKGLLVCGSGLGAAIAANKVPGARAGSVSDTYSAAQGVEHDDMNVLAVGARVLGIEVIKGVVKAYLDAKFTGEERHARRLAKVQAIEAHYSKVEG